MAAHVMELPSPPKGRFPADLHASVLYRRPSDSFVTQLRPTKMGKGSQHQRQDEEEDEPCNTGWGYWIEYLLVLLLTFVLLLAALFLVFFWCLYFREGYSKWKDNVKQQFNLHPTLMVGGIVFTGFSILLYRLGRCSCRVYVKLLHAFFHMLAMACFICGILSIFEHHEMIKEKHFTSLHSWLGLVTLGLFVVQFFIGFVTFILLMCCEQATACFRICLTPLHTTYGLTIFLIAIATALTGLVQRPDVPKMNELAADEEDSEQSKEIKKQILEQIIVNALGISLVAIAIIAAWILSRRCLKVKSSNYISERL